MEFVIGILIGGLLYWLFLDYEKPAGTFVIDLSDPMKDVCRLELDEDINSIYEKKHIKLRVRTYGDSQE